MNRECGILIILSSIVMELCWGSVHHCIVIIPCYVTKKDKNEVGKLGVPEEKLKEKEGSILKGARLRLEPFLKRILPGKGKWEQRSREQVRRKGVGEEERRVGEAGGKSTERATGMGEKSLFSPQAFEFESRIGGGAGRRGAKAGLVTEEKKAKGPMAKSAQALYLSEKAFEFEPCASNGGGSKGEGLLVSDEKKLKPPPPPAVQAFISDKVYEFQPPDANYTPQSQPPTPREEVEETAAVIFEFNSPLHSRLSSSREPPLLLDGGEAVKCSDIVQAFREADKELTLPKCKKKWKLWGPALRNSRP